MCVYTCVQVSLDDEAPVEANCVPSRRRYWMVGLIITGTGEGHLAVIGLPASCSSRNMKVRESIERWHRFHHGGCGRGTTAANSAAKQYLISRLKNYISHARMGRTRT
eukprot:GHVU01113572.1.p1 GENE.GHVU01113572.1~~GHVU01113572.1.p1  ORF type:complete len:108 (-),score=4.22 GHVU01113572.1:191-514(-)